MKNNLSNNNSNNTITFKEGLNAYTTLTIPSGSYDILELTSKLKIQIVLLVPY